ncbi:hypothetical protein C8F04DRAFT_1173431 [Mycena alexandri]|uniref:Uncharacterized protein n=1 Tax=Mycena alexandri TaxID=1745969 RepID=A0AAD6TFR1_9AGAR|nr:hypothetical protein C8F04DRAFT_1173431 [Mycena alexandri]
MPSVPSGPLSAGAKSTLVKPFVPPTEIKHLYDDFDDKVSLLMACNFAKNPDRQIRMFVETAVVIAHVSEIFEMFSGFCNKFRQFWAARPGAYPKEVREVITFTEDLCKMRTRSSATRDSSREAGLEKARADKEAALAEAQAKAQKPPRRKGPIMPAFVVTDDDESDEDVRDEDTVMADVEPKSKRLSSSDLLMLEDAELDAMIFGPDDPAPSATTVPPVKPLPTGPKAQSLPGFNKFKPGRPETVRIPYARIQRIDKTTSAYIKAQSLLLKTDKYESIKVAAEPDGPSVRKRPRRSSLYEFEEAQPPLQGMLDILKEMYSFSPRAYLESIGELPAFRVPTTAKFTHSDSNRASTSASAIVSAPGQGIPTSRALALQEFDTRSNISLTVHRLAYQLTLHEVLVAEHERLLKEMKKRDVTVLEKDEAQLVECLLHTSTSQGSPACPSKNKSSK